MAGTNNTSVESPTHGIHVCPPQMLHPTGHPLIIFLFDPIRNLFISIPVLLTYLFFRVQTNFHCPIRSIEAEDKDSSPCNVFVLKTYLFI